MEQAPIHSFNIQHRVEAQRKMIDEFLQANLDQYANILFLNSALRNLQQANADLSKKLDEANRIIDSYRQAESTVKLEAVNSNQGE